MPASNSETLIMGAVAYDPKVVTIWEGFKEYFLQNGLPFDYVLYSNYDQQVDALIEGNIHVAWNSPLAWINAQRKAGERGLRVRAVAMRDTDCDLSSLIVVRADSPIKAPARGPELRHRLRSAAPRSKSWLAWRPHRGRARRRYLTHGGQGRRCLYDRG
jgi:ABC-type phosphate/phosphonate transport system substrate-binding protein